MSEFIVPPLEPGEEAAWPSLGSQVADWQESMLAFGPGDLLGRPFVADAEDRAYLERAYQVYPPQHTGPCRFEVEGGGWRCLAGNGKCGRRRFDTVVIMTRKGTKKSERLAAVAAAELGEDAPVRCDGFRREGKVWLPIGRPVTSPFVFLLAFAKEQAEDTSWDAMRQMILTGPGRDLFDVWEERILRRDGTGEAKPLATAPDSRDGGKTTFQGKEEGHRWTMPRHHEAHQTTRGNLSKRPIAEPWEMHATTAYAPGEQSVVEELHDAARKLTGEPAKSSRLFFFYRWADEKIRIRDEDGTWDQDGLRRAIVEASGPVASGWSDIDGIASLQFLAAGADPNYAERVWLNRIKRGSGQAFDMARWKELVTIRRIERNSVIVAGFHGARYQDAAALVATDVVSGYQWLVASWEQPPEAPEDWEVPEDEVEAAVADLFGEFIVWRLWANPDRWESSASRWAAEHGEDVVRSWRSTAWTEVTRATRAYAAAIASGELIPADDPVLEAHVGAAHRRYLSGIRDDDGRPAWVIGKERQDSPHPINAAHAGIISWQARLAALKAGATEPVRWTAA